MPFLTSLNLAADEVLNAFWHSTTVLAEEEAIPESDAFAHLRQAVLGRIKAVKLTHGVDYVPDGRAARWRVRLSLWRGDPSRGDCHGDSDAPRPLDQPGDTLIHGLPAVAAWVWDLIQAAHPGCTIDELDLTSIKHKLRTLRVALSNQGGSCAWRLRYSVTAAPAEVMSIDEMRAKGINVLKSLDRSRLGPQAYTAFVQVAREEPAQRRNSATT